VLLFSDILVIIALLVCHRNPPNRINDDICHLSDPQNNGHQVSILGGLF